LRARWGYLLERRDLRPLLEGMPSRSRVAVEATWVVYALVGVPLLGHVLVRGVGVPEATFWWGLGNTICLAVAAIALLQPARLWREKGGLVTTAAVLVVTALTALLVLDPDFRRGPDGPRIGVSPADVSSSGSDRQLAEVTRVVPGTPAAGRLRAGDRILAINGEPLASLSPAADLVRRANDPTLSEGPATFLIERAGERFDVVLDLPPPPSSSELAGAFRATLLRNGALLGLLALFLWRSAQGLRALGLELEGFWTQTRFGLPALLFLMLGHFLVTTLIAGVAMSLGGEVIDAEIGQRRAVTDALLAERVVWTTGIVLVAGVTEEVVFRGFLLPRFRHVTGSWAIAVLLSVVAFGAGHLYEGALATLQTAGIGLLLSLVFLLRRHLMPCIVAHVGFNTLALALAYVFMQLGLFERLNEILGS